MSLAGGGKGEGGYLTAPGTARITWISVSPRDVLRVAWSTTWEVTPVGGVAFGPPTVTWRHCAGVRGRTNMKSPKPQQQSLACWALHGVENAATTGHLVTALLLVDLVRGLRPYTV